MLKAVKDLVVSAENPRTTKASAAAHSALVASIRAHGLIQPLVVRPLADNDNMFEVIDGGRRFAAIVEVGLDEVEVTVNDNGFAISEVGTAANMLRVAMHPLDEAAAIARALADGEDAEGIALRFGQTRNWAHQRVKLDGLSEKSKAMFRGGTFGLASAQALTLGTHAEQDAYLKSAKTDWQLEPNAIHNRMVNASINATSALFDLALYPTTSTLRDLFDENVWLVDREKFEELQAPALLAMIEKVRSEGWSDVIYMPNGTNHAVLAKYVRVEGRIAKADRSKYVAVVVSSAGSRAVSCDRGYVLRKDASKIKVGKNTSEDTADAEAVKSQTCYDLSESQKNILGAMQSNGIEVAIADGDNYVALKVLIGPILNSADKTPYAGGRANWPSYTGVNSMLAEPILPRAAEGDQNFPTAKEFAVMEHEEVMALVREAALRSVAVMHGPKVEVAKELKTGGVDWFRYDEGFLRRYRLDALRDLCGKMKIACNADSKKKDLIAAILAKDGMATFIPL